MDHTILWRNDRCLFIVEKRLGVVPYVVGGGAFQKMFVFFHPYRTAFPVRFLKQIFGYIALHYTVDRLNLQLSRPCRKRNPTGVNMHSELFYRRRFKALVHSVTAPKLVQDICTGKVSTELDVVGKLQITLYRITASFLVTFKERKSIYAIEKCFACSINYITTNEKFKSFEANSEKKLFERMAVIILLGMLYLFLHSV